MEELSLTGNAPQETPEEKRLKELKKEILSKKSFLVGVCKTVLRYGQTDMAEATANEALRKALLNAHSYDPGQDLNGWLASIAKNTAIDYLRLIKNNPLDTKDKFDINDIEIVDSSPSIEDVIIEQERSAERHTLLRNAIPNIPEMYQPAFRLYLEGLNYAQIAERLAIPENTAKTRIFRAKKHITELLMENKTQE